MKTAVVLAALAGLVVVPARGSEDPPPIAQRDVARSQNSLKQIGLAIISYSDTYGGRMPTDIHDKSGKALLSWRVAILPYIEEETLYKEFKLDEPWDSENNKKLVARMPKIYAPVRVKTKEGETFYQKFSGEKALFGPKQSPRFPASITDGTSNTGMVFEAGEPVIWSKPADIPFDEKKPLPKIGGLFDGECNVVLCDGSVKRLRKDADEKQLKLFIMPQDGYVVDFKKLEK